MSASPRRRRAADRDAVPVAGAEDRARRGAPQRGVRAPLHDREERLHRRRHVRVLAAQPLELGPAARQPAQRALHRRARGRRVRAAGDQLVELHDHVGAEVPLDAHHPSGV
jgi:hypothetical protein